MECISERFASVICLWSVSILSEWKSGSVLAVYDDLVMILIAFFCSLKILLMLV